MIEEDATFERFRYLESLWALPDKAFKNFPLSDVKLEKYFESLACLVYF